MIVATDPRSDSQRARIVALKVSANSHRFGFLAGPKPKHYLIAGTNSLGYRPFHAMERSPTFSALLVGTLFELGKLA